jgi:hypothetical protein
MPLSDPPLWETIRQWPLPYRPEHDPDARPPRTCASFEDNLRKRGDWTDASASRITEMYRKFLYLKALSAKPVTPSEAIDMAWHLHLQFSADYRALCDAVGRDIPHLTRLGKTELEQAYETGRALFEAEFDRAPDRDLWPSGKDRDLLRFWLAISIVIFVIGGVSSVFLAATVSEAWGAVLFGGSMVLFFAVAVIVDVFRKVSPPTMNRAECG